MNDETRARIQAIIEEKPVVLFMKGTKTFPRCGFSATVAEVLRRSGVTDFKDVNVLEDPEIREGIKEYTNWPTIPQLYVKGKFIGGCDIVREMYENGELQPILDEALPKSA
jgi:monothiol glutaredoxin